MRSLEDLEEAMGQKSAAAAEIRQLLVLLKEGYGIGGDWVSFDFSVVRGLAYYTGIVFEGFDKAGKLRAVCGGGRYDKLFQAMGGQRDMPAAGFGFGDAVVLELLEDRGLLPVLNSSAADVMVFSLEESLRAKAMMVAAELRSAGLRVDVVLEQQRKAKAVLQRADRGGVEVLVMLAPNEDSTGQAVIRHLKKGIQEPQPYASIVEAVQRIVTRF